MQNNLPIACIFIMANSFFRFKQFTIQQDACAMKVCTDACLFGAWCATELTPTTAGQTLLDIGTGTGLLSLMIAQKHKVNIDAVEIDAAAAEQALQNVAASGCNETIHVITGDVLNMGFSKRYDFIVSNPPFYGNDLQSPDARRNTAHHSRQLTLHALCQSIATNLTDDGSFFLLLPYTRREEAAELLHPNQLHIQKKAVVQQTTQHKPFRIMLKGGRENKSCETETILIADAAQQYTTAFTNLLRDYYLHL